jgi:hypothetical protein
MKGGMNEGGEEEEEREGCIVKGGREGGMQGGRDQGREGGKRVWCMIFPGTFNLAASPIYV